MFVLGCTKDYINNNNYLRLLNNAINKILLDCNKSEILSYLVNNLYHIGYKKEDFEKNLLDINLLIKNFNKFLFESSKRGYNDIIILLNIIITLSNFGYRKMDLIDNQLDLKLLFNTINNFLLRDYDLHTMTAVINCISDLGFTGQELDAYNLNSELLFNKIIKELPKCENSKFVSYIINSLTSIFIINNSNIKNEFLIKCIEELISKINYFSENEIDLHDKVRLNLNLMCLQLILKIDINKELIKKINIDTIIGNNKSKFEYYCECFLKTFSNIDIINDRCISGSINGIMYNYKPNFIISYRNNNYLIKLDDIHNFSDNKQFIKTNETKKEDFILQKYCEDNGLKYITISERQFNWFKYKKFKDFEQFINTELVKKNIKDILIKNSNTNREIVLDILKNIRPYGYCLIDIKQDKSGNLFFNKFKYLNTNSISIANSIKDINDNNSFVFVTNNNFIAVRKIEFNDKVYLLTTNSVNNSKYLNELLKLDENINVINLMPDYIQQTQNIFGDSADMNSSAVWAYVNAISLSKINEKDLLKVINGEIISFSEVSISDIEKIENNICETITNNNNFLSKLMQVEDGLLNFENKNENLCLNTGSNFGK